MIEQVLRMISKSVYKNHFIVKGGYLIGNMIGVEKRTTMDLDVSIKNEELTQTNLCNIFNHQSQRMFTKLGFVQVAEEWFELKLQYEK